MFSGDLPLEMDDSNLTSPGVSAHVICYAGNITYSCFDDDLDPHGVTPGRWVTGDRAGGKVTATVLLVFMAIGLPLNLFIMVSMLWKKLYRQPAHILLLNLALSEFLMCATYIPINVISGYAGEFIFGSTDIERCHVCQTGVILVVFTKFTVHIIAFISLDRFLFFKFPLHYKKYVTVKSTSVAVLLLWIFCTVLSLPPLFGFGEIRFTQSISTCSLYYLDTSGLTDNIFYEVFSLLVVFVFPVPILVITIVGIITIVCKHIKKTYGHYDLEMTGRDKDAEAKRKKRQLQKRFQVIKVYGVILLSNVFTWAPSVVNLSIIFAFCDRPFRIPHQIFVSNYLCFLSAVVIHPILQACFIPEIRKTLLAPCTRKKNQPPPLSNDTSKLSLFSMRSSIFKRRSKTSLMSPGADSRRELFRENSGKEQWYVASKQVWSVCVCCVKQPQEPHCVSNHLAAHPSPPPDHKELEAYTDHKELEACGSVAQENGTTTPPLPA